MAYYGYIRVSTKGQVPGTSLAEQEQQIRERYPTATIVREAASGAHERQVFDNLCKSLQAGDTLVVCKMDRFCRSAKEGLQYVDLLRDKGVAVHILNRDDVKVMVGWIVTAPQDLDPARYDDFFCASYDFLENRYGKENVVQAIVHDDEGGQPHLHFCFIPVEEDPKHEQGYKICANDVLDRRELRNFHPDLQRYLDEHGLEDAHVMTGVTKRQGGNRTVAQLKVEREQEYQQEVERPALYFGESKIEQGLHF